MAGVNTNYNQNYIGTEQINGNNNKVTDKQVSEKGLSDSKDSLTAHYGEAATVEVSDEGRAALKASTTTDTDNVDKEIEKLKEKKALLEQKLRNADESEKKAIETQLKQIEAELAQKNNDAYRQQNALVY